MADVAAPQLAFSPRLSYNYASHSPAGVWPQRSDSPSMALLTTRRPSSSPSPAPSTRSQSPRNDPHRLPTFDGTTLTSPPEPILYLPPLLSSLPPGYSHVLAHTTSYRPLVTDSRLPEIDPLSLVLHKALHNFRAVTEEYAVVPYDTAFNWDELALPEDTEGEWYGVVFRSKRKEGSDGGRE